tara:strand:- start:69 stop:2159 length:2091 start_codon:yes stop_codon:yes gene_type:complete
MSLIVATSRLNEDEGSMDGQRPSNFQNFFRSPIEIETDSEIAVDSVKIQRTGNITVGAKHHFCHYFGTDPELLEENQEFDELTSIARTIKPKKGTYNIESYVRQLTNDCNAQYDDPRIYGNASVTVNLNSEFQEEGVAIKFTDRGKNNTDVTASLVSQAVFNISNPSTFYDIIGVDPDSDPIRPSDAFGWDSNTGIFNRTGAASAELENSSCVGILTGRPFCLNEGEFIVEVGNASTKPFAVGLSRPQIQYEDPTKATTSASSTTSEKSLRHQGIKRIDSMCRQRFNNETAIASYDNTTTIDGTHECYDYVFIQDEDDKITIAHRVYFPDEQLTGLQELEYWESGGSVTTDKMTKSEFHASYDAIKFEGEGDEIKLFFRVKAVPGAKAKAVVYDQIVGSNLSSAGAVGRTFNPIGTTTYALYPMIHLGEGSVTVTDYNSNYLGTDTSYASPTFVASPPALAGYYPGDDMFSNEAVQGVAELPFIKMKSDRELASNAVDDAVFKCDSSLTKYEATANTVSPYVFVGMNAAEGVDYAHIITMNKFAKPEVLDTLLSKQEFPSMSGRLGFIDRAIISSKSGDGYVGGDDSKVITFTSVKQLEKTALSSFIRLPGLTHKTFNGAQAGLSKIIYQVPQFSNDGREFGSLFFQPGEKTYVKLNNPAPVLLNNLQVQIVDAFEKETNSLTGDTQIVFHIRKRK